MEKSPVSSVFLVASVFFFLSLFHGGLAITTTTQDGSEDWGYVKGGPGASGVGIGNFQEVGPLDTDLEPRNSTWLSKADLLFVDNPVGTGFSFVEDTKLFVETDEEAATDLTTLLVEIFNRNESLQKSPLYIVAESYGGKFAVTLGLSALKAIESGKLKLKLGGMDPVSSTAAELSEGVAMKRYSRYLDSLRRSSPGGGGRGAGSGGDIDSLMNGSIRKKLKIIPENVTWGGQSDQVFISLAGDFMKPRISEVDELLAKGVNVTVYNGQLDLICATKGTEAWVDKLK
ncbi:hypothetical protein C3L33_06797, partial [Rhododendron williamsianum]